MRHRNRKRPMSEINVVPYIDVMLVLLIIFMITAPLLSQGVKIDLPQVPSEPLPASDNDPVIVSVDAAGNFFINYGEDPDETVPRDSSWARTRPSRSLPKYWLTGSAHWSSIDPNFRCW